MPKSDFQAVVEMNCKMPMMDVSRFVARSRYASSSNTCARRIGGIRTPTRFDSSPPPDDAENSPRERARVFHLVSIETRAGARAQSHAVPGFLES